MTDYTTVAEVSNELNGFTIDGSSTPSSITVENWIEEAQDFINEKTGKKWDSNTITEEYHDYDGSGYVQTYHSPVITITSLSYEKNGFSQTSEDWTELDEGRTSDKNFIVYKDEGEIQFHNTTLKTGYKNIKISYTYGHSSVPLRITRLATLMTARRVISAVQAKSATTEGGSVSVGTISVSDPSTFGSNKLKEMQEEINRIFGEIGTFKVFNLDRRYDR